MRRVPAPLLAMLVVAAVHALAWAVVLPAFEGPDETLHFAYTQRISETGSITWSALSGLQKGDGRTESSEVRLADWMAGALATHGNIEMKPYASALDERAWRDRSRGRSDEERADGGFNAAVRNPPLYYLATTPFYLAASSGDVFTRLGILRLASIPLLLLVVLFTWLLAGELLGRRRWLQTLAAGAVALLPQFGMLGGVVNPDALVAALWSATLYLAVVTLRRSATPARVAGLVVLAAASGLTHGRGIALAVPVALTLAILAWRRLRERVPERARSPVALGVAAAGSAAYVYGVLWFALRGEISLARIREFGSYIWQFYLPRLDWMKPNSGDEHDVRRVFIDRFYSEMPSQFDLRLPDWAVDLLAQASVAGLVLLVVALVVHRSSLRRDAGPAVVLVVAFLAMLVSLHAAAWRNLLVTFDPVLTGRYLTPVGILFGLAIALVVRMLPRLAAPGVATALLGCGAVMTLSMLGTAVLRFHV